MQIQVLFGPALLSSAVVASSLMGAAIAKPFAANEARDAATSSTASAPKSYASGALPESEKGANPSSDDTELAAKLITATTAVERYKLLQPEDFAYDFMNPPKDAITEGVGGRTVKADRKAFPALIGTGVSMTIGFLDGCGFNTPHTHPRSAEFNVVVKGALNAEFIAENGAEPVKHNATEFQSIIFPQGAVHTEWNPTCSQSIFVAGFASEDPGVQQSAQTFFGLDDAVIKAALANDGTIAGKHIDKFRELIPSNVANGVADCLVRCKGKLPN